MQCINRKCKYYTDIGKIINMQGWAWCEYQDKPVRHDDKCNMPKRIITRRQTSSANNRVVAR